MSEIQIHSRPIQAVEPDDVAFHALVRKYLEGCLDDLRKRLETCPADHLQYYQGQIEAFKKAIAAPEKVLEQQTETPSRPERHIRPQFGGNLKGHPVEEQ